MRVDLVGAPDHLPHAISYDTGAIVRSPLALASPLTSQRHHHPFCGARVGPAGQWRWQEEGTQDTGRSVTSRTFGLRGEAIRPDRLR